MMFEGRSLKKARMAPLIIYKKAVTLHDNA